MCQQLHLAGINLAIEKQMVSDLKAQLLQAKEAARLAREAAEVAMAASYERGVTDTEARLTKEVAVVCRGYVTESWGVAMDRAAVPADFDLRRTENIFFPEDICEILGSDPPEEPSSAPTTAPNSIIPEGRGGGQGGTATSQRQVTEGCPYYKRRCHASQGCWTQTQSRR